MRLITFLMTIMLALTMATASAQDAGIETTTSCVDLETPHCEQVIFGTQRNGEPTAIMGQQMIFADASTATMGLSDFGWAMVTSSLAESWNTGPMVEVTSDFEERIDTPLGVQYRAVMFTMTEESVTFDVTFVFAATTEYTYMFFGFNADEDAFIQYVEDTLSGGDFTSIPNGYQWIDPNDLNGLFKGA